MAKFVDIHLDRPRRLRYTINAIREMERAYNKPFTQLFSAENLGFDQLTYLTWLGLKYGDENKKPLTENDVGELLQKCWFENDKGIAELTTHIMDAMQASGIIPKKAEMEFETPEVGKELPSD